MRDENINSETIESVETKDAVFEVLQYPKLAGSSDVRAAEQLFFVGAAGMRLKLVRVTLRNGRLRNEPGTLYYMHGADLEMKASTGGGVFKALKRRTMSGESFLVNEIQGTGQIYLEPSYGHFFLQQAIAARLQVWSDEGGARDRTATIPGNAVLCGGSVRQHSP